MYKPLLPSTKPCSLNFRQHQRNSVRCNSIGSNIVVGVVALGLSIDIAHTFYKQYKRRQENVVENKTSEPSKSSSDLYKELEFDILDNDIIDLEQYAESDEYFDLDDLIFDHDIEIVEDDVDPNSKSH
jgi:hypothetical protein